MTEVMDEFNKLPDLKRYGVLKMSVGELMTALNEVTPTELQGRVFGPRAEDAAEVNTPRQIVPAATTGGDLPEEELPKLTEGIILDVKPFIALVKTEGAKRRIFEEALGRRVTIAKPVAFKRVMKMFLDTSFFCANAYYY